MAKLKAMELANGQVVYVQVDENVEVDDASTPPASDNSGFERKGSNNRAQQAVAKLGDVMRAMADTAAQALENSTFGNVEKVTLEFSISLGGEVGIPYITSGKAEGAVNISIEFAPQKTS